MSHAPARLVKSAPYELHLMCHENTSFHGSRNWEASSFPNSALDVIVAHRKAQDHYTVCSVFLIVLF